MVVSLNTDIISPIWPLIKKNFVIERECIEEECSMHEFYEVYDDDSVAGPKYRNYLDCKNYIRREKNDQKNIDSLRACLSSGSPQDPRRRE